MYNQGFVVYETTLTKRKYYFLGIVHDYAMVFLDGTFISSLDRSESSINSFNVECQKDSCNLKIVVEALGHINFDHQMGQDYKGILDISDDLGTVFSWNMYKVPVDSNLLKWTTYDSALVNSPTLLKGTFNVQQVGDVYIDASELVKGYIWVNGRNLGRYWKKGPQQRLFCPGVWLKAG